MEETAAICVFGLWVYRQSFLQELVGTLHFNVPCDLLCAPTECIESSLRAADEALVVTGIREFVLGKCF